MKKRLVGILGLLFIISGCYSDPLLLESQKETWDDAALIAIEERRFEAGLTMDQIRIEMGKPSEKKMVTSGNKPTQEWIYRHPEGDFHLYFENGYLTEWRRDTDRISSVCESEGGTWLAEHAECEYVSRRWCENQGAKFQSCASACRHQPEDMICTMQCVPVCEF